MYKAIISSLVLAIVFAVWFMVMAWYGVYRMYAPINASVSHSEAVGQVLILETPILSPGLERVQ